MQQNDKSVVTERGSVDFIDEDKSSEFKGICNTLLTI